MAVAGRGGLPGPAQRRVLLAHRGAGEARERREQAAKRICAGCPVREECAAFAVALGERHGTWGGLTDKERRGAWRN
ncbi:WhiB family transcriptional regulator [Catenulispora yoronensis]